MATKKPAPKKSPKAKAKPAPKAKKAPAPRPAAGSKVPSEVTAWGKKFSAYANKNPAAAIVGVVAVALAVLLIYASFGF